MIRTLVPAEAEQLFGLMAKVYSDHSFLRQGIDAYQEQLRDGSYVSVGEFDGTQLRAHAGYRVLANYALINTLVVDPQYRSLGLGRDVFNARLAHVIANHSFDFVAGFSMMQHVKSQRLYDDAFKPIGLDIGYPDIYHRADAAFNRGKASNAELVLCRRLGNRLISASIALPTNHYRVAQTILDTVGVVGEFGPWESSAPAGGAIFLGFHPNSEGSLFTPAFLDEGALVEFEPLVASNDERHMFVNAIRERYDERTTG